MARPAVNVGANSVGLAVRLASSIIFSAIFFRTLGAAGFGLVNFCGLITTIGSQLADLGIGRTVTRELARWKDHEEDAEKVRNALFTLQTVHAVLGITLGFAIFLTSGWLVKHWLGRDAPTNLHPAAVVALTGLLAAIQLPMATVSAAMNGLERHIARNLVVIIFVLLQGLGTFVCLLAFGTTPFVYVSALCTFAVLQVVTLTVITWWFMPRAKQALPHFTFDVIRDVWTFAANDGLASLTGMLVMNGDRIILSSMLPLSQFGGYALAVQLSSAIYQLPTPINITYFPRFVAHFAAGETDALRILFWRASAFLQIALVPAVIVMAFFSRSVLEMMASKHLVTIDAFAVVLSFRVIGTGVNALTQVPYTLMLATGRSDLGLRINLLIAVTYLPLLYFIVPRYGVISAPMIWLAVTSFAFFPVIVWAHRYSGIGHMWEWVTSIIVPPTAMASALTALLATAMPSGLGPELRFYFLAVTGVLCVTVVSFSIREVRELLWRWTKRFRI